jgi:hypothetical protein
MSERTPTIAFAFVVCAKKDQVWTQFYRLLDN